MSLAARRCRSNSQIVGQARCRGLRIRACAPAQRGRASGHIRRQTTGRDRRGVGGGSDVAKDLGLRPQTRSASQHQIEFAIIVVVAPRQCAGRNLRQARLNVSEDATAIVVQHPGLGLARQQNIQPPVAIVVTPRRARRERVAGYQSGVDVREQAAVVTIDSGNRRGAVVTGQHQIEIAVMVVVAPGRGTVA